MAVEVNIISSKFYKQWINDTDFSVDTSNYCDNLAGLVMQKIKLVQQIKIQWSSRMLAAQNEPSNMQWSVTQVSSTIMTIDRGDGGSFLTDGFNNNDTIRITSCSTTGSTFQTFNDGIVSELTATHMKITFLSATAVMQNNIFWWWINGITPLTSLVYNFGLIENNENYNDLSKATDESQGWYSLGTIGDNGVSGRETTVVQMEGLGVSNAWENGNATVSYVDDDDSFTLFWQIFEIEHTFIVPYFSYGNVSDLNNNILPSYLNGCNSLKYVFTADFRTVLSNPNTSKKAKVTNVLGSVGWFNESFNGFDSNYKLNSVTYTDSLLGSTNGCLIGQTTIVTIEIEKLAGNFGSDVVGVYFSYLPELKDEVSNTITTFEENYIYDNIFCEIGGGSQGGGNVLDDCLATASTNILTVTFNTDFSTTQQVKLSNLKSYVLGFEVGDSSKDSGVSDVVILKSVNTFDDSSDIPNLMTFTNEIYPYTEDFSTAGVTDFRGWNEHNLAIKSSFILDLTKSAFVNSFEAYLVAYKTSNGSYFELDKYVFNMDNTLVTVGANTYQGLLVDTTRNYPLVLGSEKNGVKITIDQSTMTGTSPKYDIEFCQKFSWEDWIKNFDVNPIFTNFSKDQNNLNFKTSNYSNLFGYKIRMMFKFNVGGISYLGVQNDTDYLFFTPDFRIFDYDLDGNVTPNFTQVIETFTEDGTINLGGTIQVGVNTLMKITWAYLTAIDDITDWWAIHRIEESGESGKQLFEFGSYEDNLLINNILIGINNDFLEMDLISNKLVTTCLIDGNQIVAGRKYNLSGEMAAPNRPKGSNNFTARISETGELRTDENGNIRFIEN